VYPTGQSYLVSDMFLSEFAAAVVLEQIDLPGEYLCIIT